MTKLINELAAPPNAGLSATDGEVLRVWIVQGGIEMSLSPSFPQPDTWGIALVDIARHVARMYADMGECTEQDAYGRIWAAAGAEFDRPTDLGTTEPFPNTN